MSAVWVQRPGQPDVWPHRWRRKADPLGDFPFDEFVRHLAGHRLRIRDLVPYEGDEFVKDVVALEGGTLIVACLLCQRQDSGR